MYISLQIIIAALAVLGLYFCLKVLASLIFTSRQIAATVIIESEKQLEALDLLLSEADSALFATRRRRLAVIVTRSFWDACCDKKRVEAKELIDRYGAELYFVSAIDS